MGDSKRPLYFLILSCLVNIVLDIFFVVGLKLGVAGVAIATALSQVVSAVMVLTALMRTEDSYKLSLKEIRFYPDVYKRQGFRRICKAPAILANIRSA